MAKARTGYVAGALLTLVVASFAACSVEEEPIAEGGAGNGGDAVGGEVTTPEAGRKHGGEGGGGSGGVAVGGAGSHAGGVREIGGYRVLESFDDVDADQIISWPEQKRIAVRDIGENVIKTFDVNATEEGIVQMETFKPLELHAGAKYIVALAKYGDDLLAVVTNSALPAQQSVVKIHQGSKPEPLLELPQDVLVGGVIADPAVGVVVKTGKGLLFAKTGATTWKTLAEDRRYTPLAFDSDKILIGIDELERFFDGAGGQGGAGGEGGLDTSAHVQWLDLDGKELNDFVAYGTPQVAVKDDAGWLIGETNSFWGSYRAGIELLTESGLKVLTKVPVISAGDGTDGAYDLAHAGDELLVANCESGLLKSPFSTTQLTLEPVPGDWNQSIADCAPTAVEALGNVIIVGGHPLLFLQKP
jgi:hypothetical protein